MLTAVVAIVGLAVVVGLWLWTPDRPRAELEAKYLQSPADYVDAAGVRLHVRDSGPKDAPADHPAARVRSEPAHLGAVGAEAGGKIPRRRYDLPGFALTGADPTGDYSEARSMQVLAALMDKLGIAKAILIGNSIGGRLAWNFAAQYPARVDKLVLISPDGFASPGYDYGKHPDVPALAKLMRYVLPKAMLRMNLAPAYADPAHLTDATVTRYYDLLLAPGARGAMLDRMGQTMLEPPEPLLRRVTAPTLLLWGAKDALIPIANAADYLKAMPDATLVTLPDLGHVPHEEMPEVSLAPVLEFIAGRSP